MGRTRHVRAVPIHNAESLGDARMGPEYDAYEQFGRYVKPEDFPRRLELNPVGRDQWMGFLRRCTVQADEVLTLCMSVRGSRPGKPIDFDAEDLKFVAQCCKEALCYQPILLELEAPIKVCEAPCLVTLALNSGFRSVEIYMASTMTFSVFSNMVDFRQMPTICS